MTTGPVRLADRSDRDAAVTTFDRNVVVIAGAGTGKTSLLVERLLVAVGTGRAHLRRVAAVTFTEKAAGEMRERLAEGLDRLVSLASGAANPDPAEAAGRAFARLREAPSFDAGRLREWAAAALEDIEGATITTVHGFCVEILRSHPFESDLPPNFEVDAGERAISVFETEWERFLAAELGPATSRAALWERVLESVTIPVVEGVARAFSLDRIPGEALDAEAADAADRSIRRAAGALRAELESVLGRSPGMKDSPREFTDTAIAALSAVEARGTEAADAWPEAVSEWVEKGAPKPTKSVIGEVRDEYVAASRRAARFLGNLARVDDTSWSAVLEAISPFVASFRDTLAGRGLVGFDSLLVRARDLLRDHPEAREHLRGRWSMLLLDEFQDTDPLQYEIVLFLGEVAGGGARDAFSARLAAGRLFVVGDPKQSIYRFRGADYSAFVRAARRIVAEGGIELSLTANFRSEPRLLEAINRVFAPDCTRVWSASDVQPDYRAVTAGLPEETSEPCIEVLTVDPGEDANAERRRIAEGLVLAEEITRLVAEGRTRYRDVFVLFRAFSNLPLYLRALREAGIPFVVDGGKAFFERTEVAQLLALLRALAVPDDPVAILAFLRSPAGAVSDVELAAWAAAGGRLPPASPPDPVRFPRLAAALDALRALADETRDLPADRMVHRVLRRSGLLAFGAFAYEGPQRVANLGKTAAMAASLARDGSLSFSQVLEAIEQAKGSDVESESPLADENTDAVRLLTVHKAKGLEAPHVFVADLARRQTNRPGEDDPDLAPCLVEDRRTVAASSRSAGSCNAVQVLRSLDEARHEEAEEIRLLYVSMTRARKRLTLLAAPVGRGTPPPWLVALGAWGYDAAATPEDGAPLDEGRVRHRLARTERTRFSRERPPGPSFPDDARYESAIAAAWGAAERCAFGRPSALGERETRGLEDEPREKRDRDTAREAGVAMHRLLELWPEVGPEGLIRRAAGVASSEGAPLVSTLCAAFLEGPLPRRLEDVKVLAREIPLHWSDSEGYWKGIADFVYRDRDGRVVVADWKTDADASGAAERYAGQLRAYARALRLAMGLDALPRAELWMVRTGEILDVPLDEETS